MGRFGIGPPNAVDEFASTFREWHYFAGGAALASTAVVILMFVLLFGRDVTVRVVDRSSGDCGCT